MTTTLQASRGKFEGIPDKYKGAPLTWCWQYLDREGLTSLGIVARYDRPDCGKDVIPYFKLEAGRWTAGHAAESGRALYGLHSLNLGGMAYVLEGEKCAAALHQLGMPAVTNLGGSNAAHLADWTPMDGCGRVVILPDNDTPGDEHCKAVAGILAALRHPPEVYRLDLPDLPDKGDVVDWIQARCPGWDGYTTIAASDGRLAELRSELEGYELRPVDLRHGDNGDMPDAPIPLLPEHDAEPYPVDALGAVLGGAAKAIQYAVQAPMPMCAQSILAATALAVQAHADFAITSIGKRPIGDYFLTIGASGERKSGVDKWALLPVRDFETELRKQSGADKLRYENEKRVHDEAIKSAKRDHRGDPAAMLEALEKLGPDPLPPASPVRVVSDMTIEGLQQQLERGHPALGIFTDEGGTVTGGHGMLPENLLHTLTGLSELWDGKPLTRARKLDGTTVIAGKRVSLHLMMQPEVAALLLDNSLANGQGFLSRCLTVWPESNKGNRPYRDVDLSVDLCYRKYAARMRELLEKECHFRNLGELDPVPLSVEGEALEVWRRFHDDVEGRQGPGGDLQPIDKLASKMAEHAARLACILAVFEGGPLDVDRVERGCRLAAYYLGEAMRIKGCSRDVGKRQQADRLLRWMQAKGVAVYTVRDIQREGPHELRPDAALVRELLGLLVEHGHVERQNRKPERYRLRMADAA